MYFPPTRFNKCYYKTGNVSSTHYTDTLSTVIIDKPIYKEVVKLIEGKLVE